jgi:hypothetical protein
MPWEGFEPMIPAFERVKTVHALDRVATLFRNKVFMAYTEEMMLLNRRRNKL